MPNRIIKESICTSESVDQLTAFQETVFYRLIVNCDDFGRLDARAKILKSKLFPLKDIRTDQIEESLKALSSAELVVLYTVDGKPFLQMKTWEKHQQIRAKKSKYPAPESDQHPHDHDTKSHESASGATDVYTPADENILPSNGSACDKQESASNHLISSDIKSPRNPIQSEIENPNPIQSESTSCAREAAEEQEAEKDAQEIPNSEATPAPKAETPTAETRLNLPPLMEDPELGRVMCFYLDKINPTPAAIALSGLKDYTAALGADVVLHAMQIAVDERKVSWSYLRGILSRYQREGLRDIGAVLLSEQRFEDGKAAKAQRRRTEIGTGGGLVDMNTNFGGSGGLVPGLGAAKGWR